MYNIDKFKISKQQKAENKWEQKRVQFCFKVFFETSVQGIKGNIYKQASELALGKIKKSLASKKWMVHEWDEKKCMWH